MLGFLRVVLVHQFIGVLFCTFACRIWVKWVEVLLCQLVGARE